MKCTKDAWSCYRLRWQVELLIRRMRQLLSLDALSSAKAELVEALFWANLCALALVGAPHQRLWPEARAEKVGRELMQTGRVLAWLWSYDIIGRVLDLDDWLTRRMLPQDPHRALSRDDLMPVPGG